MGNLSSLILLQLGDNNFHSAIPSSLVNSPNLLFLDLAGTNFVGSIPPQLFSIPSMLVAIDLSLNNFEGTLPSEIGNLFNLNELHASESNLTGKIPNELGKCNCLEILFMDGNNFQGTLPSSFASLRGLQVLDLSRNNLSGKIPEYLEKFSLKYLNLSFNNFEGEVPDKGVFANASAIFVKGNSRLCGGIPELKLPKCINHQESKRRKLDVVKFVTIAISGVFCVIILLIFLYCKFKEECHKERSPSNMLVKAFESLSYGRILKATNGFSSENLLGMGSFGTVYKGNLVENGGFIAVKVVNLQQRGAGKSFMAECKVLQNISHRNLVRIITSCSSIDFQGNDFKALVYEYMPNGNLEKWLHLGSEMHNQPIEQLRLNLLQRLNISIDVGNALYYLHRGCHEPIIHCDLKPSNILLDNDMVAHIGDFGLAKFLPQLMNPVQSSSLGVRGTIGYTAPEYGLGSELSTSGDVYSYGILLLEMMTGKKPTDGIFAEKSKIKQKSQALARFGCVTQHALAVLSGTPMPQENINPKACLPEHGPCSRLDRAMRHARATNSSLDVPMSTARAEPSLELRLQHAQTVPHSKIPPDLSNCSNLLHLQLSCNKLAGNIPSQLFNLSKLIKLLVFFNSLNGPIPPSIGNLTSLAVLAASDNFLVGTIPDTLGQLKHLTLLQIHDNKLSGTIPQSIYNISTINHFSVSENHFHGSLPSNIGILLPQLQIFQIWGNNFSGSIPVSLSNATKLLRMELANNNFTGKVDVRFGGLRKLYKLTLAENNLGTREGDDLNFITSLVNCSYLRTLDFSGNRLKGVFPNLKANLSSSLQWLSVGHNQIYGGLPRWFFTLVSLTTMSIQVNQITGAIPMEIGNLEKLQVLYLDRNRLSGPIPSSIGNLSFLIQLGLADNNFRTSLPSGLDWHNMLFLDLFRSNIIGSIPKQLFSTASMLVSIDLSLNNFEGTLPSEIGSSLSLNEFYASKSNLSGKIPSELGQCKSLVTLYLDGNNFQGTIPMEIGNIELDLQHNRLKGILPNSKANLSSSLQFLIIGHNQIYGTLPQWLFTLVSLTTMSIEVNQITGTIPMEIVNLENLQLLILDHNRLSGPVPSSIGNLSSLILLQLDDNNFHSTLPSSLENWRNMLFLDLSRSNFIGSIPKQLFSIPTMLVSINLSLNNFEGTLPSEIGNLFNLNELYVSENSLTGKIPNELGKCNSLEILFMNGNNFQGTFPSSFASLRGLRILDLSPNNLSGKIPEYLEKLSLEYLNLSFNNFEGEIPIKGVFANASAIFVEGNNWLCGGIPELKLPRCLNHQKSKRRKLDVVKFVTIAASGVLTIMVIFLYCKFKKKTNKERPPNNMLIKEFLNLSYVKILKATNGFSQENLLGVGSFGAVYKGNLEENGTLMAVKVVNLEQQGAAKSFMAECKVLQNIRHRNLVRIITSCSSIDFQGNDFKALVYEYMPNGNLEKWLHPSPEMYAQPMEQPNLNLPQRMNIAIDVGNALDYLHCGCQEPIIHCDLKPSNILLDNDMVAHIGDFGLAKFIPQLMNPVQSSSLGVRGTIGYAAPAYGLGSEPSTSGDVYSYGILLLEMVTGKKPTDDIFQEGLNLHSFARMALPDNVLEIADPVLLQEDEGVTEGRKGECLIGMIKVGVSCSMESPQDRMDMGTAVLSFSLGTAQLHPGGVLCY
ncbi:hypothetical protein JCGZ_05022 [Jatropha curcas]|uniref:non-specific serine/threonine protein kinase n=1 Tax=Jatropha curcas TaxID=180498 RepID=A0A067L2Y9_JATCU|nr:hypothetical protein JCGZ_05022 [Jatropha curcas]